jgi:hypothetical protein
MFFTFCVAWAAMLALAYALYRIELVGKRSTRTCASCARR